MKNAALAGMMGGLLLTGACAAPFQTATDPQAPLSGRIQGLVEANRDYPRWADFPAAPADVPRPEAIATRVAGLDQTGQALSQSAAALEWTFVENPDAWAESVRSRVEGARPGLATALTAAEIEAFARSLRERAEPPPPIDPRQ